MRILLTVAALAVLAATTAVADSVEGIWQTEVDDGVYAHVKIAPCGSNICGTIDRNFNSEGE